VITTRRGTYGPSSRRVRRQLQIAYGTFELHPDLEKHVRSLKVGWTNFFVDEESKKADDVKEALEDIIEGCKKWVTLTIVESNQGSSIVRSSGSG